MAYSNNKETVIAEIAKNNRGDFIIVKNIVDAKGNQSIDIRYHFTNDDDQVLPTKKGVRYSSELALEVIRAQAECLEASDLQDLMEELQSLAVEKGLVDVNG